MDGEQIFRTFSGSFHQNSLLLLIQQALSNRTVPGIFGIVQKFLQLSQGRFEVTAELSPGTPLEQTDRVMRQIQAQAASAPGAFQGLVKLTPETLEALETMTPVVRSTPRSASRRSGAASRASRSTRASRAWSSPRATSAASPRCS